MNMEKDNVNVLKRDLDINEPLIKTNPYITNRLAILSSHQETLPWLYSNFINYWMHKDYSRGYLADLSYFSEYRFCPFFNEAHIDKRLISKKWENIIDAVIDVIDSGAYVYLNINSSYTKLYTLGENRMHDILVYGYDKGNKTLSVADFFRHGKYSFEKVSFEEFTEAYDNLYLTKQNDFLNGIKTIYYDSDEYKFSIEFIVKSLKDYLLSRNTMVKSILEELDNEKNVSFGLSVYDELTNYVLRSRQSDEFLYLDYRAFHYFYEHKVLMINRIQYLEDKGYIEDSEEIKRIYEKIAADCATLRNIVLKFAYNHNQSALDNAIILIKNMKSQEEEALFQLLKLINYEIGDVSNVQ